MPYENIMVNIPQKSMEILSNGFGNIDIPPISKRFKSLKLSDLKKPRSFKR